MPLAYHMKLPLNAYYCHDATIYLCLHFTFFLKCYWLNDAVISIYVRDDVVS